MNFELEDSFLKIKNKNSFNKEDSDIYFLLKYIEELIKDFDEYKHKSITYDEVINIINGEARDCIYEPNKVTDIEYIKGISHIAKIFDFKRNLIK